MLGVCIILWQLAGLLVVGPHICWLAHLEHAYILWLLAVGWITHSGPTYMSAGMLGASIYFIAVGWITHSGPTYMLAGTFGAPIYFIPVGWTTHSEPTYMLAVMPGAHMIISGCRCYLQLKDIISAKIGWNAICGHLPHIKIHLK